MIAMLLSGPEDPALFRFCWRGAPFEGLIRSFNGDSGTAWAGSRRVCLKSEAAQLLESDRLTYRES
jgi:hypothetical protein